MYNMILHLKIIYVLLCIEKDLEDLCQNIDSSGKVEVIFIF
jgi:hypothetical protein